MPRGRVIATRRRGRIGVPIEMLKEPIPIWAHLKILAGHSYAEDTILLYEVTNQATSSNNVTLPEDPTDLATYRHVCELYDKTKRFAQAGAILKTIIQTFPNQRPFTYPSLSVPVAEQDRRVETEAEMEEQDYIWYCYYCVLHKTHKFKDAYDALMHLRGETYRGTRDQEMPELLRRMKNPDLVHAVCPDEWKPDIPDEYSARICSSSMWPIISCVKKSNASKDIVKRFSNQFTGTAKVDVYWWLKSAEAAGKNKIYEAIACLEKMTHRNPRVLTEMAKLNYQIDKRDEARRLLKTAHSIDNLWIDGMDLLVFLCIGDMDKHGLVVQDVVNTLGKEWPHRVETFIVNGFMAHQFDIELADAYASRALRIAAYDTDQYVYAVHLKAYCSKTYMLKCTIDRTRTEYREELIEMLKNSVDAMPESADLALLYVDALMENEDGHREAKLYATKFLHDNPDNVHAKLLKVHVLVNGITRNPEANHPPELIELLNSIIDEHPHILAAFCFLLNEYLRLNDNKRCREVLDKLHASRPHLPQSKISKMHRVRADFLLKFRDVIPAYQHLMAAMSTGAVVDAAMMANYEQEFAESRAVRGDYKNLAFIDSIVPKAHFNIPSVPSTSSAPSARYVGSPPLQEVVNDHENEQEEDSTDYEDEEDE